MLESLVCKRSNNCLTCAFLREVSSASRSISSSTTSSTFVLCGVQMACVAKGKQTLNRGCTNDKSPLFKKKNARAQACCTPYSAFKSRRSIDFDRCCPLLVYSKIMPIKTTHATQTRDGHLLVLLLSLSLVASHPHTHTLALTRTHTHTLSLSLFLHVCVTTRTRRVVSQQQPLQPHLAVCFVGLLLFWLLLLLLLG